MNQDLRELSEGTRMLMDKKAEAEVTALLDNHVQEEDDDAIQVGSSDDESSRSARSIRSMAEKSDGEATKQYIFVGTKVQKKAFRKMWKDPQLKFRQRVAAYLSLLDEISEDDFAVTFNEFAKTDENKKICDFFVEECKSMQIDLKSFYVNYEGFFKHSFMKEIQKREKKLIKKLSKSHAATSGKKMF